ncbi:unnamed protein product [Symbiodinium natans]|uniref:Uncharacterized protein n=1 Tax=Symbiodinium natans TaxID=878477 RepID=A0A812MPK2_9DINO|nr:unnamed protein product [Symbiodinium natans]
MFLAGLGYEVLEGDHYVPGQERHERPRFKNKDQWKEILLVTAAASVMYAARVVGDFDRAVGKNATVKEKADDQLTSSLECCLQHVSHQVAVSLTESLAAER